MSDSFRDKADEATRRMHPDQAAVVWALLAIEDRLDVLAHALHGGVVDPRRAPAGDVHNARQA
jgi:hypothetical protein